MLLLLVGLGLKTRDNLESFFEGVGKLEVREETESSTVYLKWRGKIDAPMETRLAEAFEQHQASARRFVLSLSSSGGALSHGARVVKLLRRIGETHGLDTVVESGSRCASMCVPVYLQGQRRTAAENARFMFHEVSFREYLSKDEIAVPASAKASETDRLFADYFAPAGVSQSWITQVRADMTGGHDIWKTARELADENANIVQEIRD